MAASSLVQRVILLSFAAEHRKSYWSGCIKASDSDLSADCFKFWRKVILAFKNPL